MHLLYVMFVQLEKIRYKKDEQLFVKINLWDFYFRHIFELAMLSPCILYNFVYRRIVWHQWKFMFALSCSILFCI